VKRLFVGIAMGCPFEHPFCTFAVFAFFQNPSLVFPHHVVYYLISVMCLLHVLHLFFVCVFVCFFCLFICFFCFSLCFCAAFACFCLAYVHFFAGCLPRVCSFQQDLSHVLLVYLLVSGKPTSVLDILNHSLLSLHISPKSGDTMEVHLRVMFLIQVTLFDSSVAKCTHGYGHLQDCARETAHAFASSSELASCGLTGPPPSANHNMKA